MATQEDLLQIQQLRDIAGSLRGATKTLGQGQQNVVALQAQQQQGELARQQQLSDIGSQRQFATQQREAQQGFAVEQREAQQGFQRETQAIDIEGRKEIARIRGSETQINIDLSQIKAERDAESANTLVRSNLISQEELAAAAAENRPPRLDNIKILDDAEGQFKFISDNIIDLESKTDEQFQAIKSDENVRTENLRKQLIRADVRFSQINALKVRSNDTKESYIKRLKGVRTSLRVSEVINRLEEVKRSKDFGIPIFRSRRDPQDTPAFRKQFLKDSIEQARIAIAKEVLEEFGGDIE